VKANGIAKKGRKKADNSEDDKVIKSEDSKRIAEERLRNWR